MRNFDSNVAVIPWKLRFGRKNSIFQRDATIHPFLSNNKIPTERDPTSELTFGNDADPFPEHQPSQDTLPGGDRGTKKPSPSKPSPSSEEEQTLEKSTNIRMEEKEISDIEIRFKENYAIKNVDRQSNMLGLLVIYYLLIFCDTFITNGFHFFDISDC